MFHLGRPATNSPDSVVRLLVLRVRETSWGRSDREAASRHRIWLLSNCRKERVKFRNMSLLLLMMIYVQ